MATPFAAKQQLFATVQMLSRVVQNLKTRAHRKTPHPSRSVGKGKGQGKGRNPGALNAPENRPA